MSTPDPAKMFCPTCQRGPAPEPTPEPPGMTSKQAMKLPLGLYCVFWTEAAGGGMSVAAVGAMHSGKRWLAPANWTAKDERFPNVASSASWHDVERVERIACDEPEIP